jgi:MFS family permease
MNAISSILLLALPLGLVVGAGTLVRRRGDPATAERRTFLFLVWTGMGLLSAILALPRLLPQTGYGWATLLAPITTGVLAMTFVYSREWASLRRGEKALIVLALICLAGLVASPLWRGIVAGNWQLLGLDFLIPASLLIAVLLAAVWMLGQHNPLLPGVVVLFCLALFNLSGMVELPLPGESPGSLSLWLAVYLALPTLTVAAAATLVVTGLMVLPTSGKTGLIPWRSVARRLALAALLLGGFVYTFWWVWVWDSTDDGVRGYLMIQVSTLAAITVGMVIAMTTRGWRRWLGLPLAIGVIGMMFGTAASLATNDRSPHHQVTETRAARIQAALERFQTKTGSYPAELAAIVPAELWWIPQPMILPDQEWCYQGGTDYFQLGALYREYWSTPFLVVQVYASAGDVPETSWECDRQLAEIGPQYEMVFNTPATPIPLPTSAVSVARTVVEPVLRANSFSVGSWSPDGAYLVFGLTSYYGELGDQMEIDLHFLQAETGEVCEAGGSKWRAGQYSDGLREHSAWLADGSLLYVSEDGEMMAVTPCADSVEDMAIRYPVTFTRALSFNEQNQRVLLKSEDAYWLLDTASLDARPITNIAAIPSEIYRGFYVWSLGGERLALSLMHGPDLSDEASLIVMDVATGRVERSWPLAAASDASLPIVTWLTSDELLLRDSTPLLMDLHFDPPRTTDLIGDIFLLDIEYPTDFSSLDSLPNLAGDGYYVGVRANHPRNQGVYLYASATGQVELFQHDSDSLFFFPGGQWLRLPKWEDTPTYRDEYELVWLDETRQTHQLAVEGHTPRSHPQLFPVYLPNRAQLVFSSSQGISLVSLPFGETLRFWEPAGGRDFYRILATPNGEALVAVADGDGLYYIPLPPLE